MIPNLAVIRIESEHFRCPMIPVPLFLIWIVVLLLSPLILLVLLVMWALCLGAGYPFWRALRTFLDLLCSLPGTDVRVTAEGNHVTVKIL